MRRYHHSLLILVFTTTFHFTVQECENGASPDESGTCPAAGEVAEAFDSASDFAADDYPVSNSRGRLRQPKSSDFSFAGSQFNCRVNNYLLENRKPSRDLWPGNTVIYAIDPFFGRYCPDCLDNITTVITLMKELLPCVKFTQNNETTGEDNVWPGFGPALPALLIQWSTTWCGSSGIGYIGYKDGFQTLQLSFACAKNRYYILHQFFHIMGLHHEHLRPERDAHVRIYWDNIVPGYEHHFQKIPASLRPHGVYNQNSIMHPAFNAWSTNNRTTMRIREGMGFPYSLQFKKSGFQLEITDILNIRHLYGCDLGTSDLLVLAGSSSNDAVKS